MCRHLKEVRIYTYGKNIPGRGQTSSSRSLRLKCTWYVWILNKKSATAQAKGSRGKEGQYHKSMSWRGEVGTEVCRGQKEVTNMPCVLGQALFCKPLWFYPCATRFHSFPSLPSWRLSKDSPKKLGGAEWVTARENTEKSSLPPSSLAHTTRNYIACFKLNFSLCSTSRLQNIYDFGIFGITLVNFWKCLPQFTLLSQRTSWNAFLYHLPDTSNSGNELPSCSSLNHGRRKTCRNSHTRRNWQLCPSFLLSPSQLQKHEGGFVSWTMFDFIGSSSSCRRFWTLSISGPV